VLGAEAIESIPASHPPGRSRPHSLVGTGPVRPAVEQPGSGTTAGVTETDTGTPGLPRLGVEQIARW